MPLEPLKVHILTRGAYYAGLLHYAEVPGAVRPRLLDYLNAQAKGRQSAGEKKIVPMLRLDNADVAIYRADRQISVQSPQVAIAARAIVIAFDEGHPAKRDSVVPEYEKRQALEEEPLVIMTRTRHRLTGKVRGGVKRLTVLSGEELFIAVTNVSIEDLSTDARAPANLPFVALNMEFVESFWEA
jgi:hypothetical protein